MYRNVINDFAGWYESRKRKILYVKGAYGVGKTWAVKDFATAFFGDFKYIDMSKDNIFTKPITGKFEEADAEDFEDAYISKEDIEDVSMESRIADMDFLLEQHFDRSDFSDTLLIFDEVGALSGSDEFFHRYTQVHRNYTICLIASTMEITEYEYGHPDVFQIVRMRPMSFEEYMIANKAHPMIAAIERNKSKSLTRLEEGAVLAMLKEYMLIGGMPLAVFTYLKTKNYNRVREVQNDLIEKYRQIIKSSLSPAVAQRCRRIWNSIPKQLEKGNKKFMYKLVEENARAREYSEAAQKLCDLGFVRKLPRLTEGIIPLEEHVDYKSFEFFMTDHGLLRAVYGLPADEALSLLDIFTEKNGAIAEQYIFQELSAKVGYLYYWVSGATARVPFVYESDSGPVPVDVRFMTNNKAQNIKTFKQKNPSTEISLKISLEQVSLDEGVLNIPAYGLWNM